MRQDNSLSLLSVATQILTISALLLQPGLIHASDLAREHRLAEQIIEAILDGEPVMLAADGREFLSILTAAETQPAKGAAIILHGRGTHPDWSQVAGPLRTGLPGNSWATLALQMPVLGKEATYYDYVSVFPEAIPRIRAGIRYLRDRGMERIVLIAHSCGVHMSMAWVSASTDDSAGIDAYVGIGMGATDYQQPMRTPFPFDRLQVPLLSIYGSEDYPAVQRQASALTPRLPDIDPASRQVRIAGADHYFEGYEAELITTIADWLETLPRQDN